MTLKELRKRKFRTMQEFADKLEVPMCRIAKWELGITSPKIKDLPFVAKTLGVSVNTLLKSIEEGSNK